MNKPECSNCNWWEQLDYEHRRNDNRIAQLDDVNEHLGPWGTCSREDEPAAPMYTVDGEDYWSALRTLADHYCRAHQPKGTNG